MKKIFLAIFTALFLMPFMVSASETEPFYTNMNGAELNEQQYNNLLKAFSEDTIATMTVEAINQLKDNENLKKYETTKFVQVDEIYNHKGELISTLEKEITEEEAMNIVNEQKNKVQSRATIYTDSHQTSVKRVTITLSPANGLDIWATVTNTWFSIPSVKSHDVVAMRPSANSVILSNSVSGYQKYDGKYHNYTSSSSNTKLNSGGLGISMNIDDTVSSSLECSITALFTQYSTTVFGVFGTYQHATSTVTLAQSQNYSFGDGYGGVLVFNSSVASKYDRMGGVYGQIDWLNIG